MYKNPKTLHLSVFTSCLFLCWTVSKGNVLFLRMRLSYSLTYLILSYLLFHILKYHFAVLYILKERTLHFIFLNVLLFDTMFYQSRHCNDYSPFMDSFTGQWSFATWHGTITFRLTNIWPETRQSRVWAGWRDPLIILWVDLRRGIYH